MRLFLFFSFSLFLFLSFFLFLFFSFPSFFFFWFSSLLFRHILLFCHFTVSKFVIPSQFIALFLRHFIILILPFHHLSLSSCCVGCDHLVRLAPAPFTNCHVHRWPECKRFCCCKSITVSSLFFLDYFLSLYSLIHSLLFPARCYPQNKPPPNNNNNPRSSLPFPVPSLAPAA